MAERNFRPVSVNIRCLKEWNPPPELDNRTGLIQINVKRFPDNSELSIREESEICLQVHGDCSEDARKSISEFVVETAKKAIGGSASMKTFLVYVHLEVDTVESLHRSAPINDQDVNDGDERIIDDEETDMESDGDMYMTSDDDETDMVTALSLDGYENKKVGASRSAIDGLKRERFSYGSGGDNPAKNSSDANACVICMEKFEAGTVVRYMPCSHIFHEVCLVPWLQDNNSCPLCRLEIQSSSSQQSAV
ncbi:hypothetical protein MKW98_011322 [Papaver atlanticum]|uniref:RING-type domain-containing protein n=1 Tax=Papaver atlanticum TaxID=357466 RepID=A0AAD4SVV9_9MAGN|nr:hypothetical protein MKW98_011322 [Papaver atlanticum]